MHDCLGFISKSAPCPRDSSISLNFMKVAAEMIQIDDIAAHGSQSKSIPMMHLHVPEAPWKFCIRRQNDDGRCQIPFVSSCSIILWHSQCSFCLPVNTLSCPPTLVSTELLVPHVSCDDVDPCLITCKSEQELFCLSRSWVRSWRNPESSSCHTCGIVLWLELCFSCYLRQFPLCHRLLSLCCPQTKTDFPESTPNKIKERKGASQIITIKYTIKLVDSPKERLNLRSEAALTWKVWTLLTIRKLTTNLLHGAIFPTEKVKLEH